LKERLLARGDETASDRECLCWKPKDKTPAVPRKARQHFGDAEGAKTVVKESMSAYGCRDRQQARLRVPP
jgi:hypothetical protein